MIHLPFDLWYSSYPLVGGDWRFFWSETLSKILDYSYAWDSSLNSGLGGSNLHLLSLNSYLSFGGFFLTQALHIPWFIGEKLLYFWPILCLSFLSSYFLSRRIYKNIYLNVFAGILYIFNTYALAIFGGGQVGLALAYSVAPLVLGVFIKLIHTIGLKSVNFQIPLLTGIVLAINVFFDLRIAYIVLGAVFIYFLLTYSSLKRIFFVFAIPLLITLSLHAFWILPSIIFKIDLGEHFIVENPVSQLRFFSFALFENSFSLLHPNWPENIFGKTGFMKPEFIMLPILAYSSLLFIKGSKSINIIFFALIGLLGAFLAKGMNEPFGNVYLWLYEYIPGFIMFRDPTKFYLLVVLSYSVLIPFSVYSIYKWLGRSFTSFRMTLPLLFLVFTILYFIFLIRPVFLGELGGTFRKHEVPKEYALLKDFLHSQTEFFRTLWIPQWQRFGYFSNNHPAVGKKELFLDGPLTMIMLKNASVKYVIVPYDSEGEIFLSDRKYDEKQYLKTIEELKKINWLKQVNCSIVKLLNCYGSDPFGKISVFELSNPKDHFFIESTIKNEELKIAYETINPTKYKVKVSNAKKNDILVFSESFDRNWVAKSSSRSNRDKVQSSKFNNILNSFVIPKDGEYSLEVYYEPQKFVNIGLVISGLTLVGTLLCLLFLVRSRKPKGL